MSEIITEYPQKAKAGKRYLAIGIDIFLLVSVSNTIYATTNHNPMIKFYFIPMYLLYFSILEGTTGKTLGKMILQIKVVKENYTPIGFLNSIVKHLFDIIDFLPTFGILGLVLASSNKTSQRVGDFVAKTIVIEQ